MVFGESFLENITAVVSRYTANDLKDHCAISASQRDTIARGGEQNQLQYVGCKR